MPQRQQYPQRMPQQQYSQQRMPQQQYPQQRMPQRQQYPQQQRMPQQNHHQQRQEQYRQMQQRDMQNRQMQQQYHNTNPGYQPHPSQQRAPTNRGYNNNQQENFSMPPPNRNPNLNTQPKQTPPSQMKSDLPPHEKEIKAFGMGMMSSLDSISGFGTCNSVHGVTNDQFNVGLRGDILPIDNKLSVD